MRGAWCVVCGAWCGVWCVIWCVVYLCVGVGAGVRGVNSSTSTLKFMYSIPNRNKELLYLGKKMMNEVLHDWLSFLCPLHEFAGYFLPFLLL